MSFYTALTGLKAATAQLGVTSNNIANVSTVGFKRSRTDFGDIFATSPLQKASATIGQGVALKGVTQEFGQGNTISSSNTLDMMISGDGFFPLKSQDGFQDIYTRNGVFMMNDQYNVVNAAGQKLMAASVDSSGKANLNDMNVLTIPQRTTGMAKQTSKIEFGLNLPSDATVISKDFDRNDASTYNKSTALTVYDAGGNAYLATIYYAKTQNASQTSPYNKWQTYVYVGDQLVNASLQQATNTSGDLMYVNKYGQLKAKSDFTSAEDQAALMSSFAKKTQKFSLDALTDVRTSQPAAVQGSAVTSLGTGTNDGVNMKNYTALSKVDLLMKQGSESAVYDLDPDTKADSFTVTFGKSGSSPISVPVNTVDAKAPTVADVVTALNSDATFAATYVAQASTEVKISGLKVADPSFLDKLNITIDGKSAQISNIKPESSSLGDIAARLQERLRSYDGGNSNISVSVAGNNSDLVITDSLGRKITDVSMTFTADGQAAAAVLPNGPLNNSVGTASNGVGKLQVAAIDPSVSNKDIRADIEVVKKVGNSSASITGVGMSTDYPRVTANYDLSYDPANTLSSYSVTIGSGTNAQTVSADALGSLVTKLNNNTTFAAKYKADYDETSKTLSVTARNPADGYTSITSALHVKVTSKDPNDLLVTTDAPQSQQTAAIYNLDMSGNTPIEVMLGTSVLTLDADPTTSTAEAPTTLAELVTALNHNDDFSANFKALIVDNKLKIYASKAAIGGDAVAANVLITDTTGTALTVANGDITTSQSAGVEISSNYAGLKSADELRDLFQVNVDGSKNPVTVGLAYLAGRDIKLSGTQIAQELTNVINRGYGDEKPFNFAGTTPPTFTLQLNIGSNTTPSTLAIDLTQAGDSDHNMRYEDLVSAVQAQIDANPTFANKLDVSYDTQTQQLAFTPRSINDKVSVLSTGNALGITDPITQGVNDSGITMGMSPNVSTSSYRAASDQKYGINVQFDAVTGKFVFNSGTTGDTSSISITHIKPNSLATQTTKGLGMTGDPANYVVSASSVDALRGVASEPAVLTGNAMSVNVDNNFSVDSTNNIFVVSVNGVTGTVTIPPKDTYTIDTFMEALQNGINGLQTKSENGLTPRTIDGVKVAYDRTKNALTFTGATASSDSYIKVTGNTKWGLDGLEAQFGKTTTWIKPSQFTDGSGVPVFIDALGNETTSAAGFDSLPEWSPVYFDKGELTFDTAGNLVSPKQGAQLDTVYLPNGKGALTINIDYAKSTQSSTTFSVLSQSQDGAPEGDLVGLAIKEDGLVQASYSNGAQKSLAKIVLINFSNPSGLRQIGDTNYYSTIASGAPKYGEAGSAGFGTVRSGATERANVDLTQELVDLITEQRNFQASAKAMETDTQLTQTIIQIRN